MNGRFCRHAKVLLDLGVLAAAFCLASLLPFEAVTAAAWSRLAFFLTPVVVGKLVLLASTGRLRSSWRYTHLRDIVCLFNWCALAGVVLLLWRLFALEFKLD